MLSSVPSCSTLRVFAKRRLLCKTHSVCQSNCCCSSQLKCFDIGEGKNAEREVWESLPVLSICPHQKFKIMTAFFYSLAAYSICFWVFSMYPPKKDDVYNYAFLYSENLRQCRCRRSLYLVYLMLGFHYFIIFLIVLCCVSYG